MIPLSWLDCLSVRNLGSLQASKLERLGNMEALVAWPLAPGFRGQDFSKPAFKGKVARWAVGLERKVKWTFVAFSKVSGVLNSTGDGPRYLS